MTRASGRQAPTTRKQVSPSIPGSFVWGRLNGLTNGRVRLARSNHAGIPCHVREDVCMYICYLDTYTTVGTH